MTDDEPSTLAAPELSVAGLTDAETIDLLESWLKLDPDMRLGKARLQGQQLRLSVTRGQFSEAKRRLGITAPAAPHPDHRPVGAENSKSEAPVVVPLPLPAAVITARGTARRRSPVRRGRRSISLADMSNLAENLSAIVAERDRARAAIQEIARIVKALRGLPVPSGVGGKRTGAVHRTV